MPAGHRSVGKGEKPDDRWTLPLCSACHGVQHTSNEMDFWRDNGIAQPHYLSLAIQGAYPDQELVEEIISAWG